MEMNEIFSMVSQQFGSTSIQALTPTTYLTREQMDDRASISISDALQYTPSIQTNYFGEDNKQDWFITHRA